MPVKNINEEHRLQKIEETRNYLLREIDHNELISKKHKNIDRVLNYTDYLLISTWAITGCVFISAFASLVGILIGITSSAIELKNCVIAARINKKKNK